MIQFGAASILCAAAMLPAAAGAQGSGSITPYGQGCVGTGRPPGACGGINTAGGTLSNTRGDGRYAFPFTTVAPIDLERFDLWTKSTSGGVAVIATEIYLDEGGAPAAAPVAASTMNVHLTIGFQSSYFRPSIRIPGGATFYVAAQLSGNAYLPNLTGGTPGVGLRWHTFSGWLPSPKIDYPSFQLLCFNPLQQVPYLATIGECRIGQTLTASVHYAAPASAGSLLLGGSKSVWVGGTLPYDLGGLGAPSCALLASPEILTPLAIGTVGTGSVLLPVPADPGLVGNRFYEQALILDAGANRLGIAASRGIELQIGS